MRCLGYKKMEKLTKMVRGFPVFCDNSHVDSMRTKLKDDLWEKAAFVLFIILFLLSKCSNINLSSSSDSDCKSKSCCKLAVIFALCGKVKIWLYYVMSVGCVHYARLSVRS